MDWGGQREKMRSRVGLTSRLGAALGADDTHPVTDKDGSKATQLCREIRG